MECPECGEMLDLVKMANGDIELCCNNPQCETDVVGL